MKRSKLIFLLPALAFLACSKDSVEDEFSITEPNVDVEVLETEVITEAANFDAPGSVSEVFFGGMQIPVENFNGEYVYQGDILLSRNMVSFEEEKLVYNEGETPVANKSAARTSDRWPNNTVYYSIDQNLANQARVIDAIKHWEENSALKFVKRTNESNYINFTTGSGCSSYVGMIGGRQNLTLSSACTTGNAIHEIGHAVGLWHEQSRVDRDSFITINFENIQSGREHNFATYKAQGMDGKEFTSTLDFSSIMMYGSYSFSGNGKPTMVKKNGSTFGVQRSALSDGDKIGINAMYPVQEGPNMMEPAYENGNIYYLLGVNVLRANNRWYFYTKYGWKSVYQKGQYWYYL